MGIALIDLFEAKGVILSGGRRSQEASLSWADVGTTRSRSLIGAVRVRDPFIAGAGSSLQSSPIEDGDLPPAVVDEFSLLEARVRETHG